MNIYEMFGRMSEEKQANVEAFLETLELLKNLQMGKHSLDEIKVEQNGWNFKPKSGAAD